MVRGHHKITHKNYPHILLSSTQEKKRGVLLAIKDSVDFHLKLSILDKEGRFIIVTGGFNFMPLTIATIYAPNMHQVRFLRFIFNSYPPINMGNSWYVVTDHGPPSGFQFHLQGKTQLSTRPIPQRGSIRYMEMPACM